MTRVQPEIRFSWGHPINPVATSSSSETPWRVSERWCSGSNRSGPSINNNPTTFAHHHLLHLSSQGSLTFRTPHRGERILDVLSLCSISGLRWQNYDVLLLKSATYLLLFSAKRWESQEVEERTTRLKERKRRSGSILHIYKNLPFLSSGILGAILEMHPMGKWTLQNPPSCPSSREMVKGGGRKDI